MACSTEPRQFFRMVALVSLTPVLFRVLSGLEACPDRISGENHISEKYGHAIIMSLLQVSERIASE